MIGRQPFLELLAGLGISRPHRFETDSPAVRTEKLTQKTVELILIEEIEGSIQSMKIDGRDSHYLAPETIEPLLNTGQPVAELESIDGIVDCEDYAQLWASMQCFVHDINAVGWVTDPAANHAYNCVVTANEEAVWIEPQQNKIVELGEPLFGDVEDSRYGMKSGGEVHI